MFERAFMDCQSIDRWDQPHGEAERVLTSSHHLPHSPYTYPCLPPHCLPASHYMPLTCPLALPPPTSSTHTLHLTLHTCCSAPYPALHTTHTSTTSATASAFSTPCLFLPCLSSCPAISFHVPPPCHTHTHCLTIPLHPSPHIPPSSSTKVLRCFCLPPLLCGSPPPRTYPHHLLLHAAYPTPTCHTHTSTWSGLHCVYFTFFAAVRCPYLLRFAAHARLGSLVTGRAAAAVSSSITQAPRVIAESAYRRPIFLNSLSITRASVMNRSLINERS